MKKLTKILIGAGIVVGTIAATNLDSKTHEISGVYNGYSIDASGEAYIKVNNQAYPVSIEEKQLKKLRLGKNYIFDAKNSILFPERIIDIKDSLNNL
jgi:hypothetical protein